MNQIPTCTFEHDCFCDAMVCYSSQPCGARDEQGWPRYIPRSLVNEPQNPQGKET